MLEQVSDRQVWNNVRLLYVGSGVLFLATILLGFLNIFADAEIARGQILAHFHSGTIGWVTLGVIATTVWVFTGGRTVDAAYVRFTSLLAWVGLAAAAGYILAFYLAFNGDGPFWMLPLFGVPAALVILGAFLFAWMHLRSQTTLTTVHLLLFGALLVASLGASMGLLRGLQYASGISLYPDLPDVEPVGAHAGPMDMYLALAFAAVVELLLVRGPAVRWTKPGLTQMLLGAVSAFIVSFGLYFGVPQVAPIALLLFLLTFLFYFVRIGWRTFTVNPLGHGRDTGIFWGGLFLPVYIGLFVYLVAAYFIPGNVVPHALEVTFVHVTFIGMATNLLLAAQLAFAPTDAPRDRLALAGVWTVNLGLFAFIVGEYAALRRDGAALMGIGLLIALAALWRRMAKGQPVPVVGRDGQPL